MSGAGGGGAQRSLLLVSFCGDTLLEVEGGLRVWSARTCSGAGRGACT